MIGAPGINQWRGGRRQKRDQVWVHRAIVIGDVQNMHLFVAQISAKFGLQARKMLVLHHQNQIGPADIVQRDGMARIAAGASDYAARSAQFCGRGTVCPNAGPSACDL